jgi:hypothetical protein
VQNGTFPFFLEEESCHGDDLPIACAVAHFGGTKVGHEQIKFIAAVVIQPTGT